MFICYLIQEHFHQYPKKLSGQKHKRSNNVHMNTQPFVDVNVRLDKKQTVPNGPLVALLESQRNSIVFSNSNDPITFCKITLEYKFVLYVSVSCQSICIDKHEEDEQFSKIFFI